MARYKVLSVEENGSELAAQTEVPLDADKVYFSPTSSVVSDNVQAAIEEVAANRNFSFSIIADQTLRIPIRQQMVVFQEISIEGTGDLIIDGELAVINGG